MTQMEQMALRMLKGNPNMQNNVIAQQFIKILESGDTAAGEELAMNLCQTNGSTKEDAIKMAQQWANTAFPGQ